MITYVYSASDKGTMLSELEISIKSLRKYTNDMIIVYLTPPIPSCLWIEETIKNYKVTIEIASENYTKPFSVNKDGRVGRYGEKLKAVSIVTADNVIFFDCDTKITSNPNVLINDEFDFSGRIAPAFLNMDMNLWDKVFYEYDCHIKPMFNAGFLVFKNGVNKKVGELALEYFNGEVFSKEMNPQYLLDQYALSLAIAKLGLNVKYMTSKEHGYRWMHDKPNSVIYHGSKNKLKREIYQAIRGICYYVS